MQLLSFNRAPQSPDLRDASKGCDEYPVRTVGRLAHDVLDTGTSRKPCN